MIFVILFFSFAHFFVLLAFFIYPDCLYVRKTVSEYFQVFKEIFPSFRVKDEVALPVFAGNLKNKNKTKKKSWKTKAVTKKHSIKTYCRT